MAILYLVGLFVTGCAGFWLGILCGAARRAWLVRQRDEAYARGQHDLMREIDLTPPDAERRPGFRDAVVLAAEVVRAAPAERSRTRLISAILSLEPRCVLDREAPA